jgi:hypothetical protein
MFVLFLRYRLNANRRTSAQGFGKFPPRSGFLALVAEENPLAGVDVKMLGFVAERTVDNDLT